MPNNLNNKDEIKPENQVELQTKPKEKKETTLLPPFAETQRCYLQIGLIFSTMLFLLFDIVTGINHFFLPILTSLAALVLFIWFGPPPQNKKKSKSVPIDHWLGYFAGAIVIIAFAVFLYHASFFFKILFRLIGIIIIGSLPLSIFFLIANKFIDCSEAAIERLAEKPKKSEGLTFCEMVKSYNKQWAYENKEGLKNLIWAATPVLIFGSWLFFFIHQAFTYFSRHILSF